MAEAPSPLSALRRLRARLGRAPARTRFWLVSVPIHLAAFAVLYFGTLQLLERAYAEAGATAARFQIDQAVREMPFLVQSARLGRNPHVFEHLIATHRPIQLRLYRTDATPIGRAPISADPRETAELTAFLERGGERDRIWIEESEDRHLVRGIVRIQADAACAPCHVSGETLGVATMRLDFSEQIEEIRRLLGRRVGLLLAAWVGLLAAVTLVVQRTVRRSAERLTAELQAVSSGGEAASAELPLDPATAEIHRSLRRVLERQRERESHVVRQLAHADQLATLGQLAAGLAHEIKNPLAGIQGALEVLRDESPDPERGHLFDEMLDELRRVHSILQRLLESGRPAPLRLVRTDLGRLLTETAELLRPSLRRKRVTLEVDLAPELPEVEVDPAKLRQVLVNLIQNGAEAMDETGGRIELRASGFADERAVVVTVADDGPGIPRENLDRLFEPFYTTKFSGTGLGLAISKSLVEQHGGTIEVTSEPGAGTSFVIVLPLRADDDEREA